MTEKNTKKKKIGYAFVIGLAAGIILYKVIIDLLWPLLFG